MVEALRCKLRCFGILVDGTSEVFCDNTSVVKNSSIPTSVLNQIHSDICCHILMEAQAESVLSVGWIPGQINLPGLFTKTTMPGKTRHNFVESILSNTTSPIGGIDQAQVHFHMGSYRYLPHYKTSRGKWFLGLYIFYSNQSSMVINFGGLDKYEIKHTGSRTNIRANTGKFQSKQEWTDGRGRYKEL